MSSFSGILQPVTSSGQPVPMVAYESVGSQAQCQRAVVEADYWVKIANDRLQNEWRLTPTEAEQLRDLLNAVLKEKK